MKVLQVFMISLFVSSILWAKPIQVERVNPELSTHEIIKKLKKGGYIIYFRHADTNRTQSDQTSTDFDNCALQRNLSRKGIKTSQTIAQAFKKQNIRVSTVLSSPYCRCKDTAQYAFGKYRVDNDLRFAIAQDLEDTIRLKQHLVKLFQTQELVDGKNTVFVSHTANLKEAAGIWPKPEAVMVVFERKKDRTLRLIGKINPHEWEEFAR